MITHRLSTGIRHSVGLARCAAWLVLAWAGWSPLPAGATTEGEKALANSPLPHEQLGAGRNSAKVHWVRLASHLEGPNGNAALLDELKTNVKTCVDAAHLAGRTTRPPQVWPEYVRGGQLDEYDAANRTITYTTSLAYTVDPADCSLEENLRRTAQLASTWGICQIDLDEKTAHGYCDPSGHADAPPVVQLAPSAPAARTPAERAALQAALAALEKAKMLGPSRTGAHKRIAGVDCDVWTNPADPPDGTLCISGAGSFRRFHAGPSPTGSGMILESTSQVRVSGRALKAQLDATVNAAVFAPYQAGDFKVTQLPRRK